jgi:hypothetical protein
MKMRDPDSCVLSDTAATNLNIYLNDKWCVWNDISAIGVCSNIVMKTIINKILRLVVLMELISMVLDVFNNQYLIV